MSKSIDILSGEATVLFLVIFQFSKYSMRKFFSFVTEPILEELHCQCKPLRTLLKRVVQVSVSGTLKEIISQTAQYLVILSSKTHVFEDKMTKY